jgi:NAD+ kinase
MRVRKKSKVKSKQSRVTNNTRRKRLALFVDPKKGSAAQMVRKFADFVKGKVEIINCCGVDDCSSGVLKRCDLAVVFGGDGSIISAARALGDSNVPVIGVNLGKLGFLAEFGIDELERNFDNIIKGNVRIERRMMLFCRLQDSGKEVFSSKAINDVFINSGSPFRMIELQIKVDGQSLAGCVSDGLVISTPTGSTAYNLSSGGPILSGRMEAMVITPICPHSLSFRPIVISADSSVEVLGLKVNRGTTVSVDGQISNRFTSDSRLLVEKDKSSFLVVSNLIRNQWDTLAAKLGWAEKPKYKNSRP